MGFLKILLELLKNEFFIGPCFVERSIEAVCQLNYGIFQKL